MKQQTFEMKDFYKQYCSEAFDHRGVLSSFAPKVPADFNFAYDVVDRIADEEPDRRALVWCNPKGEEKVYTFAQMRDDSNRAANLFASHGVGKGDMVMLVLARHHQFWPALMGLHKLGAVGIPATNLLTVKDYVYRFEAASVGHIIAMAEGEVTARVETALEQWGGELCSRFVVGGSRDGWVDFDAALSSQPATLARVPGSAEDPLLLYFTSGTTGMPKMVYHDHAYPIAHILTAKYWHNLGPHSLHLTVSETGWMKSMWGKLYGQWLVGAAVFVYDFEKFDPAALLSVVQKYQVTSFCAPPTIYRFLIKENMDENAFASVEYATTAGEALHPEVFNRFYELTGLKLMEAFGQSETTVLAVNLVGSENKVGSMGKPSPQYDVQVLDENGEPVGPGEEGEIVVRIPEGEKPTGIFCGYFEDEELTRSVWHDGNYHTGDIAKVDADGYLWYVGRTDDVIKASGYRIGPFEIESVLMEHPAVLECAVTGAPDPVRGTVVKATVVLARQYQPSDALAKELQQHVKEQTAPYKYPRILEFVDEMPKTISGKIRRVALRQSAS